MSEQNIEKEQLYKGVFRAGKKDGTVYYRASLTKNGKHISLGSFSDALQAHRAYEQGLLLLSDPSLTLQSYEKVSPLSFEKWVSLINLRDNGLYIGNPIYLGQQLFYYYLSPHHVLKFDMEDLFYYSSHKIMCRGNHYFVADYGMQQTLTSRYGIKSYGVPGVDYCFVNGDPTDFRRENLQIHNIYHGVRKTAAKNGQYVYTVRIHIRGNYIVGPATLLISKQPLPITRPSIFCIAKESPVILPPTMWKPSLPAVMPRSILRSTLHRES